MERIHLQLLRGHTHQVNTYTGKYPGEMVIDMDKWDLHIMDGKTPGGEIVREEDAYNRYMNGEFALESLNLSKISNPIGMILNHNQPDYLIDKKFRFFRGNSEQVREYTGPIGEIVENTETCRLHIQDGVTAGGHVI